MKTIKIIDLLNKIANGEEVPKIIKFKDQSFEYDEEFFDYYCEDWLSFADTCFLFKGIFISTKNYLNNEVEILDEEDEFEDIKPVVLKTFERTGQAITIDRVADYYFENFKSIEDGIFKVILNQKKIIEWIKNEKKKD